MSYFDSHYVVNKRHVSSTAAKIEEKVTNSPMEGHATTIDKREVELLSLRGVGKWHER
jgi:hypothetical protein